MAVPLIPIIMLGAGTAARVVSKVAPQIAKRLIQAGKAKRASLVEQKVLSSADKAASATSKAAPKAAPKMGPKVKKPSPEKKATPETKAGGSGKKPPEPPKTGTSLVPYKSKPPMVSGNKLPATTGSKPPAKITKGEDKGRIVGLSNKGKAAVAAGAAGIAGLTAAALNQNNSKTPVENPIEAPVGKNDDFEEKMNVGQRSAPPARTPAPVEQGKPGMTRAEAEEKGIAKPEGLFQDIADLIAGGKGKGTVEYDYPSDDKEKKHGGMVYRMKGGKVGKATKRGTGKAMSGAQISYGKPMKEGKSSYKSGGKVGMRGCGVAQRGYGKAMKGK